MPTLFLRRPLIYVEGFNGRTLEVYYMPSEWQRAHLEFAKMQESIKVCQKALESVPSTEPMSCELQKME